MARKAAQSTGTIRKKTVTRSGDLRHTYAVNAVRAGDDIKTKQENLGHASAALPWTVTATSPNA